MGDQFQPLSSDNEVTVVQSLCMQCHEQGTTRMLLCSIPFFRGTYYLEIVVMSFSCDHCGFANNDIQSATSLAPNGVHFELKARVPADLARYLVKSEHATLAIVELGFEIPASSDKATYTNLEGILTRAYEDLELNQPHRQETDPQKAAAVGTVIDGLKAIIAGERFPFTVVLDDPSGNSHITHDLTTYATIEHDPDLTYRKYKRTHEQLVSMGYAADTEELPVEGLAQMSVDEHITAHNVDFGQSLDNQESSDGPAGAPVDFKIECFACGQMGTQSMCVTQIPNFKETVVMGFRCDYCGASTTEVKGGGGISPKGMSVILHVTNPADLNRSIIKSDSAVLKIPEIGLELAAGTLGGIISTVEGLLDRVQGEIMAHAPSAFGDSLSSAEAQNYQTFIRRLFDFKTTVSEPYTIELEDPLANSFIAKISEEDTQVEFVEFERTEEQNDDLGLTDMRV